MKNFFLATLTAIFSCCILLVCSCTDPLDVGSDLLDEDQANVGFTDTLKLQAKTIVGDSISVYIANNALTNDFIFGRMVDPYFGVTEGAVYLQPLLSRDLGGQYEDFVSNGQAIIDSIVLILPLDSSAVYGDISGDFGIDVFEVAEAIDVELDGDGNSIFYSNVSFDVNPMPLASTNFTASFDSVFVKQIINTFSGDTVDLKAPHLRINLDPMLGQRFLDQDTATFVNDSTFLEFFQGLYLKPTGTSSGLLDLSLNNTWGGVHIFYKEDGESYKYKLELGTTGRRISQYNHDYTGAVIDPFIGDTAMGDSLLFMQGLQGLLIEFQIPDLENFNSKAINQAVLEFTVATFPDYDIDLYPPVSQIVALQRNAEGELIFIDDVAILSNDLGRYFGGQPFEHDDDGRLTYTFNMSIYAQYLMDGTESNTVYLAVFPRAGNTDRIILKGPGASENPAILKVSFTDL